MLLSHCIDGVFDYYAVDISATKLGLSELKKYLTKSTKPGNEVELWSIWLGGDFTKHYSSIPKTMNIPSATLYDIEESIDYYAEEHFNPEITTRHNNL